jgi:uncharacterized membrane protein
MKNGTLYEPKKEKIMFKKTQELILVSLFSSIILMLSLIPNIGLIVVFGGVSLTIIHIPVLIGAMTFKRVSNVLILGFVFGLGSLLAALMRGSTPIDLAFVNPLISVVPRILFAAAAFYMFKWSKFLQTKMNYIGQFILLAIILFFMSLGLQQYLVEIEVANTLITTFIVFTLYILVIFFMYTQTRNKRAFMFIPTTALLSTLLHTVFVLSFLVIVRPALFNFTFNQAVDVIYGIMITNGLLEAALAVLVVTPIVFALKQALGDVHDTAL